jgi:hypothetical protein
LMSRKIRWCTEDYAWSSFKRTAAADPGSAALVGSLSRTTQPRWLV